MKYSELFFIYSLSQSNIYNLTVFPNDEDVKKTNFSNYILIFYLKSANETNLKHSGSLLHIESNTNSIYSTSKSIDFSDAYGEVVSVDSVIDADRQTVSIILCILKKPKPQIQIYEGVYKPEAMEKFKPLLVYKKDIGYNPLQSTHTKYWNHSTAKLSWMYVVSVSDECLYNTQEKTVGSFIVFTRLNVSDGLPDLDWLPLARPSPVISMETDKKPIRRSLFGEKTAKKRSEMDEAENRYEETLSSPRKPMYSECSNYNQCFPEISLINQKILYMDFKIGEKNLQRISCFGSDVGNISMFIIDLVKSDVLMSFDAEHNSPITSIRLIDCPYLAGSCDTQDVPADYSVLVCSAVEPVVVYRNVVKNSGFHHTNQYCLKESDLYDCVLCSTMADVDMDGDLEILIGTFQQSLLVYKWCYSSTNSSGVFRLVSKLKCAGPIHRILHIDTTCDGLKEIVVLTSRGVHVFQLNTEYVMEIINKRLTS